MQWPTFCLLQQLLNLTHALECREMLPKQKRYLSNNQSLAEGATHPPRSIWKSRDRQDKTENAREQPWSPTCISCHQRPMEVTADNAQGPDLYRWWLSEVTDSHYRLQHLTKPRGLDVQTIGRKPFCSQLTINLKEQLIIYSNLNEMEGRKSKFLLANLIQCSQTTTKSKFPSASKGLAQRDRN